MKLYMYVCVFDEKCAMHSAISPVVNKCFICVNSIFAPQMDSGGKKL